MFRFWVNWDCKLEAIEMPRKCTVTELAEQTKSAAEAPSFHKLFVLKGLKLNELMTLADAGVRDGSVLHLVLNDDPYTGGSLYVKGHDGKRRLIPCGPDFYVEDIKEELSAFQDELPPEETRLVFAGRELQDHHTLKEYNLQKPSVLVALSAGGTGQQMQHLVAAHSPAADEADIPLSASISIIINKEEEAQQRLWGHISGPPFISTFSTHNFIVTNTSMQQQAEGVLERDEASQRLTWVPRNPLQAACCYTVTLRDATSTGGGWLDSLSFNGAKEEASRSSFTWTFYTMGYKPLRLTAVYPRPHSRVGPGTVGVILRFNSPIRTSLDAGDWVSVRGHALDPPVYDAPTCSLLFPFAEPLRPMEICRVRVRETLIKGARGECMVPLQPDGIIKSSTFRWKFYAGSDASYEEANLCSSGLANVLARYRQGALVPLRQTRQSFGALLSPGGPLLSPTTPAGFLQWGGRTGSDAGHADRRAFSSDQGGGGGGGSSRALRVAIGDQPPHTPIDPWSILGLSTPSAPQIGRAHV